MTHTHREGARARARAREIFPLHLRTFSPVCDAGCTQLFAVYTHTHREGARARSARAKFSASSKGDAPFRRFVTQGDATFRCLVTHTHREGARARSARAKFSASAKGDAPFCPLMTQRDATFCPFCPPPPPQSFAHVTFGQTALFWGFGKCQKSDYEVNPTRQGGGGVAIGPRKSSRWTASPGGPPTFFSFWKNDFPFRGSIPPPHSDTDVTWGHGGTHTHRF